MIPAIEMIAALSICFLAAVLNLALNSRFRNLITRAAIIIAMIIGIILYGYGFGWCFGFSLTALARALMAVCRMVGGINDFSTIQSAPLFRHPAVIALFWLAHFLAFYATASTAIAALGEQLLRGIRVLLLRKGPLLLIYGINVHSVAYGQRMAREKHRSVLFVDDDYNTVFEGSIKAFGAVLDNSTDAMAANMRFLQKIRMKPGKRQLELAVLHTDGRKNLAYATALLKTMTASGIQSIQTSLLAAGIGDEVAALQALGNENGYGNVYAFDDYALTARMMLLEHPPCDLICFDSQAKAMDDFHAVILGFGRMGRAVLHQLVISSQFYGSRFQVDIFDPRPQNGFLHDSAVTQAYDIRFHSAEGISEDFYEYLEEHERDIRMIVLCTGNLEKNREIAEDLSHWFPRDRKMPLLMHATRDKYFWLDEQRHEMQSARFYDSEGFDLQQIDAMAMQVHHIHSKNVGTARSAADDWRTCSYADRQSSRACADFYPAVLRASGRTVQQVLSGDWPPDSEMLENLSQTEHLRWSAYQYASGYSPMSADVWNERAAKYQSEKSQGREPAFRISKDETQCLQACLIPWDDLNALSRRENAITGGHVDYQQMDRNNILILPRILAAQQTEDGKHG